MEVRKALINWDKTIPKINKMDETEKELIATYAQGIIARGKLEKRQRKKNKSC